MSEQTPEPAVNATDDALVTAESEPSMEDILASIRKIISDDADPVPLDGPNVAATQTAEAPVLADVSPTADASTSIPDVTEMSSLMDGLAEDLLPPADLVLEGPDSLIDDIATLDDDLAIPELEAPVDHTDVVAVDVEDDMDRLMNELLVTMDGPEFDAPIAATAEPQTPTSDSEMDVVKSLMADLTDDAVDSPENMAASVDAPSDDAVETETNTTAAQDELSSEADELDDLEGDIFDSILNMTLEDEIDAFDSVAEVEAPIPSLADIAAAADAVSAPAPVIKPTAIAAAVAGAATVVAAHKTVAPQADAIVAPKTPEPAQPAPSEMETPMPSALRSDAILDDVTEVATMTAFAELNQVVEDKAILSERGPRIGDLVQDALKPMLKEWLDANIQGIVERAVAKEVKRIASGK